MDTREHRQTVLKEALISAYRTRSAGGKYVPNCMGALVHNYFASKQGVDGSVTSYWHDLALSTEGDGVSYCNGKTRVVTKLGRYIRKFGFASNMPDAELDHFCREVFAIVGTMYGGEECFVIVPPQDVPRVYERCIGGSSCMTGDAHRVQAYALSGVECVVYTTTGDWRDGQARALLWTTDKGKVLDRVYPNGGSSYWKNTYHQWAKEQGIVYRLSHSLPNGDVEFSDGKEHTVEMQFEDTLPYLDTFHYCHEVECEHLTLSNMGSRGACDTLDEDFLDRIGLSNNIECEDCGGRFSEDEVVIRAGRVVCASCEENYHNCDICYESCHDDDLDEAEVASNGGRIFVCDDCRERCEHCDDWIHDDVGDCLCSYCRRLLEDEAREEKEREEREEGIIDVTPRVRPEDVPSQGRFGWEVRLNTDLVTGYEIYLERQ